MKNQINQLFFLLSLVISTHMLTAMDGESMKETTPAQQNNMALQPKIIDVQEVMNSHKLPILSKDLDSNLKAYSNQKLTPTKLLALHQPTPKTIDMTTENGSQSVDMNNATMPAWLHKEISDVTPAALLVSTLHDANYNTNILSTNENALNALTIAMNDKDNNPDQQLLARQARALLIRKQPNLVQGIYPKLQALPDRFMSYFKEKLPTFTTAGAKQQFMQLIVGDTISSMSDFNSTQFTMDINAITNKYNSSLNHVSTTAMFTKWSANIIQEIALLPFRVTALAGKGTAMAVGGVVRGGVGAALHTANAAVVGTAGSLALGGIAAGITGDYLATGGQNNAQFVSGMKKALINITPDNTLIPDPMNPGKTRDLKHDLQQIDPNYFSRNVTLRSNSQAALDTVGGVAAGAATGALVAGTGLAVTAAALPFVAVNGAREGAYYGARDAGYSYDKTSKTISQGAQAIGNTASQGARYVASTVGQAARTVYDQGSQLLTPASSRLTPENLTKIQQGSNSNIRPRASNYNSDINSVSSYNPIDSNAESFNPTISVGDDFPDYASIYSDDSINSTNYNTTPASIRI